MRQSHRDTLPTPPTVRVSFDLPNDPALISEKVSEIEHDRSLEVPDRVHYLALTYRQYLAKPNFRKMPVVSSRIVRALRGLCEEDRMVRFEASFQGVLEQVAEHFLGNTGQYNCRNVIDLCSDFSHIGYRHCKFFKRSFERLKSDSKTSSRDFSQLLFASGHLDIQLRALAKQSINEITKERRSRKMGRPDDTTLAQTAWAIAKDFPERLDRVVREQDLSRDLSKENWTLIYHSLIVAEVIKPGEGPYVDKLQSFERQQDYYGNTRFEKSVGDALRRYCASREHILTEQPIMALVAADYLIVTKDREKIVVECDGDLFHSSIGPDGKRGSGRDVFQDKLFKAHGATRVLHLWSDQWDEEPSRQPHIIDELLESR
jgi:hypothetical protein